MEKIMTKMQPKICHTFSEISKQYTSYKYAYSVSTLKNMLTSAGETLCCPHVVNICAKKLQAEEPVISSQILPPKSNAYRLR